MNIEELLKRIENRLTDANTGSYEEDECGEDYFDDALNIQEVKDSAEKYCHEFIESKINFDELYEKLSNIEVRWDIKPMNNFYPFKSETETLKHWKIVCTLLIRTILKSL